MTDYAIASALKEIADAIKKIAEAWREQNEIERNKAMSYGDS